MRTIFRKELADHFTSLRVFILFLLVYGASAAGLIAAYQGIRGVSVTDGFVFLKLFTTSGEVLPPFTTFITLFVPIIGITLGFDAINREHQSGTISRMLSQPMYRDSLINGKFLAGIVTIYIMILATMLVVAGAGLSMIGVPPTPGEINRLFIWFLFIVLFGAFWMSLAILFSVLLKRIATSLLATIAIWLFFGFFILLIAPAVANALAPIDPNATDTAVVLKNFEIQQLILRFSPNVTFSQVTGVLLFPTVRSLGLVSQTDAALMIPNPLTLGQSLQIAWPLITTMLSLTIICFAISYVAFMRQEIRST